MEEFKNGLRLDNLYLQLTILVILAIFDVIMTMIGLNMGLTEKNPLWLRLGEDVFIFRMVTGALFTGLFGLVGERYPDSSLYRSCRKALIIGIIITGIIVIINGVQILWVVKESYDVLVVVGMVIVGVGIGFGYHGPDHW